VNLQAEPFQMAAGILAEARYLVALTGAGISTPSGIPDFRSPESGLWANEEALEVASLLTFRYAPERFYHWFRPLAEKIWLAEANPAHRALVELEKRGILRAVLTQNIDLLHQKAGSQTVVEMHGTLQTLSCTRCFARYEAEQFLPDYLQTGRIPRCSSCGAVLKPDVVLFGEQLPERALQQARAHMARCDVLLVAGSSLEVLPVASLPVQALDRGAHLIIINRSPTYLDVRADAVFHADVAEVLPELVRVALEKVP
jgi:NAD-dependent deacetylase